MKLVSLKKIIFLFIFGCARSSLPGGLFFSCAKCGLLSSCGVPASHCTVFSCYRAQALEHRLSSCGAQTLSWLCAMWDLPGSEIEPVSPALAGGFFTMEPPGKPKIGFFFLKKILFLVFIWLYQVLVAPHRIFDQRHFVWQGSLVAALKIFFFSCGMQTLNCNI